MGKITQTIFAAENNTILNYFENYPFLYKTFLLKSIFLLPNKQIVIFIFCSLWYK